MPGFNLESGLRCPLRGHPTSTGYLKTFILKRFKQLFVKQTAYQQQGDLSQIQSAPTNQR